MTENNDLAKHNGEDGAFRSALRRERLRARESLPAAAHAQASAKLLDHLYALLIQRPPSVLGFYWPIRAEIDCRPLVARLIALGWSACLPVIMRRHDAMEFRAWTPASAMVHGEHGIPTVAEDPATDPFITPDVLLLPLNAFDRKGFRLGYGGGYYDRTLAAMTPRPFVIGVGFELGRVASIRPHAQDCAMDAVVTERGPEFF